MTESLGIAHDYEFHSGTRYRHVHAPQVGEETYLPLLVGAHERYEHDVALLSLESVYRVRRDELAVGTEEVALLYQLSEILHLCPVWRDDAHVDTLFEDALLADLLEISLQGVEGETRLALVYPSETLTHKLLVSLCAGGVYPYHRLVVVQYSPVFHLRSRFHHSAIKPVARKAHYPFVHAVLHFQQRHHLGLLFHDALHQRLGESATHRLEALHRWRQLTMVAGEHHSRRPLHGNPACSLKCLCCLVDE